MAFEIPIAFCIYNRLEPTVQVFQAIRRMRPQRLLIVADGPRSGDSRDEQAVEQTRAVLQQIDWPCDVSIAAAETNLGCRQRIATGLDWAFSMTERLIILEDDCLPHESFFRFCRDLLEHYAEESQVMMVSGDRFVPEELTPGKFYFSRWTHIWGWASWRRAWQSFDASLESWPEVRTQNRLADLATEAEAELWRPVFDRVHRGEIDTWDFSWQFSCWAQDGLVAIPPRNLVTNIGFGSEATHTHDANSKLANLPAYPLRTFEYPRNIERNLAADRWTHEHIFSPAFAGLHEHPPHQSRKNRWWKFWTKSRRQRAESVTQ